MSIDFDTFLHWAEGHFGKENVKIKGNEILTHSPFTEDHKFHLWMNPSGGKRELAGGAYRCWYTDRMGSLISLVAELDKISYEDAEEILTGSTSLRKLEKQIHDFFSQKDEIIETVTSSVSLELPPFCSSIDHMSKGFWKMRAINYLESRQIPTAGLYVCTAGDFKNRIVIPYHDREGRLFYYNARTMSDKKSVLRYMKPDVEGLKQTEVLFMPSWPRTGSKIYLTEGEFDAISLHVCGFYSAAFGGKEMSDSQIEMLRPYLLVLAFDTDEESGKRDSGGEALLKNGEKLLSMGIQDVHFVRPPRGFKDWNKLLVERGANSVRSYIKGYEKPFTSFTATNLRKQRV